MAKEEQAPNTEKTFFKWEYLVQNMSKVFRMTQDETELFRNSVTAKIIAAIPFAAGCDEPEKTAIAHLSLYIVEARGFETYCSHSPEDDKDVMHRLMPIANFKGGNTKIIRHGMTMLALIMLEGYNRSRGVDFSERIYNPLNAGVWNYQKLKTLLLSDLAQIEVPQLDDIFYTLPLTTIGWGQ